MKYHLSESFKKINFKNKHKTATINRDLYSFLFKLFLNLTNKLSLEFDMSSSFNYSFRIRIKYLFVFMMFIHV